MNHDLVKYYVFVFMGATFTSIDGALTMGEDTFSGMSFEVDLANEIYLRITDEIDPNEIAGQVIPYTLLFSKPGSQIRPSQAIFPVSSASHMSAGFFQPFVEVATEDTVEWISLADTATFDPKMQQYREIISLIDATIIDMEQTGYIAELAIDWQTT